MDDDIVEEMDYQTLDVFSTELTAYGIKNVEELIANLNQLFENPIFLSYLELFPERKFSFTEILKIAVQATSLKTYLNRRFAEDK